MELKFKNSCTNAVDDFVDGVYPLIRFYVVQQCERGLKV